jgi:hypothetical protein
MAILRWLRRAVCPCNGAGACGQPRPAGPSDRQPQAVQARLASLLLKAVGIVRLVIVLELSSSAANKELADSAKMGLAVLINLFG